MIKKYSKKGLEKKKEKAEVTKRLHAFFLFLWDKQAKNGWIQCFECGKWMKDEIYRENSCCYSHLIAKSKRPDLAFLEENIKIVHPSCHSLYELNPTKAINQYNAKKILLNEN